MCELVKEKVIISKEVLDHYRSIDAESNELRKRSEELLHEQYRIKSAAQKYLVENKLYLDLDKLKEYAGNEIHRITLVTKDGEHREIWDDEILEITDEGKVFYSSYEGGILEWSESKGKYVKYCYRRPEELDVVGFYNLIAGSFSIGYEYKLNSEIFSIIEGYLTK